MWRGGIFPGKRTIKLLKVANMKLIHGLLIGCNIGVLAL